MGWGVKYAVKYVNVCKHGGQDRISVVGRWGYLFLSSDNSELPAHRCTSASTATKIQQTFSC